jgi:hypothetical protein
MGALDLSGAIYGAGRAAQDIATEQRTEEGFQTDQAIRKQQLAQEQELQPLRKHSLELGVQEQQQAIQTQGQVAPLQIGTAQLNLDTARMNKKQLEQFNADAEIARTKQIKLRQSLGEFHTSNDPQILADGLSEIYPQMKGTKAERNADGSITVTGPKGKPFTFQAQKWPDGSQMSADDAFSMFAYDQLDPVKSLEARFGQSMAVQKEAAKQSAIEGRQTNVETVRGEYRVAAAEARHKVERERRIESDVKLTDRMLMETLKTTSIPGNFANSYSSDDDAKLVGNMREAAIKEVRAGDAKPETAVKNAIEKTRSHFAAAKKTAIDAAMKLMARGVNPKDAKAVGDLQRQRDRDATAMLSALSEIQNTYGTDIAKYALDQLPTKKR